MSYLDPSAKDFDREKHIEMCISCQQILITFPTSKLTCHDYQQRAIRAASQLLTLFKQDPTKPHDNYGLPRSLPEMVNAVVGNVERGTLVYYGE